MDFLENQLGNLFLVPPSITPFDQIEEEFKCENQKPQTNSFNISSIETPKFSLNRRNYIE